MRKNQNKIQNQIDRTLKQISGGNSKKYFALEMDCLISSVVQNRDTGYSTEGYYLVVFEGGSVVVVVDVIGTFSL